jgi:hypothetical protein
MIVIDRPVATCWKLNGRSMPVSTPGLVNTGRGLVSMAGEATWANRTEPVAAKTLLDGIKSHKGIIV